MNRAHAIAIKDPIKTKYSPPFLALYSVFTYKYIFNLRNQDKKKLVHTRSKKRDLYVFVQIPKKLNFSY